MKALKNYLFSALLASLVFASFSTLEVCADVIVDNGDSGTFSTGTWRLSGGSLPYGDDSLWARDGATYTWQFDSQPAGIYEVLMWWSQWPSRATEIDVDINYYSDSDIVTINQYENTGQWNSLGTYYFDSTGSVTIIAAYGSTVSTCADAVWFRLISENTPPAAYIDSITPNPAEPAELIEFTGHGQDSDGNIAAYSWESSIDGNLSDANSFSTDTLSEGVHTIYFEVQDDHGIWSQPASEVLIVGSLPVETIVDNRDADTSQTGTWQVSDGADPYGTDSVWSRDGGTFTWYFTPPQTGEYEVSMWWTQWSSRSTNVPVNIEHSENTDTVYVNQQQDGGQWNSVGTYYFNAETSYAITVISQPSPSSTCADAVKFDLLQTNKQPTAYIDSITPNPAELEDDITFFGHGTDTDGIVVGYMWESSASGQLSDEPNFVMSASLIGQGIHTISFSVMDDNDVWSPVATEILTIGNVPPTAVIDSVTPNPANFGQPVIFTGHGQDPDGTIEAYSWTSSIDGNLSDVNSFSLSTLSLGEHTITFRVYDDDGAVSEPANLSLTVQEASAETIIDNRDSRTSFTGTWQVSSGSNPYDVDSYWSRDGSTFSWIFSPAIAGYHELFMWWTEWSSRSAAVPVDIEHAGATSRVYIDQQQNGGRWNSLGNYLFEAGSSYSITITAQSSPTSTCADAVRLMYQGVGGNMLPNATIDSISPNPARPGQMVTFAGRGTDGDGTIEGYSWRSSLDGQLSNLGSFSISTLSIGTHTIYFRVRDDQGAWSPEVSAAVSVGTEHIYICFIYAGLNINRFYFTSMLYDIGASQQGNTWTYVDNAQNMTYIIHLVSDTAGFIQALETDGAHIILIGHSNYGLGPIFATSAESNNEMIENIRYIDDNRILNLGTPWVHVSVRGMRTGQAYPYWWPVFQDGTSGIMPYDFGDPRGDPPYNYYLTYQLPSDPNHYKVETAHNSGIQRFYDSRKPAWYSADGAKPDSNDPNHHKYFITNSTHWSPSFELTGTWQQYQELPANADNAEYFKENYIYNAAGYGNDQAKWFFTIPEAGDYQISAWWPALSSHATNTPYTVSHASGSTMVRMNQTINGRRWNEIGQFYFDANDYSVLLTDDAASGSVAADGIRISHADNPPEIIAAEFSAWPRSGVAPLDVTFDNDSIGDLTGRAWNLGDGYTNTTRDFIEHTYNSPGTYTVSLTASGPVGSDTKTKVGYITVGATEPDPGLYAEFSAWSRVGKVPRTIRFRDNSTGDLRKGITYTPAPGFAGTDTFTYTVADDDGALSNEATVTVTVYAGNIPPVASDDSGNTKPDTPMMIDVIANDTDLDGTIEPNSITVTTDPNNGTVEVNDVEGIVTYTPDAGFIGTDSFTYTVADNDGAVSNQAAVEVYTGNLSPTAGDDSVNTKQDTPIAIDVLANDSDIDGTIEPNSITVTTDPNNGIVEVNDVDGTVTYSPDTGFTGTDIFIYIVVDDEGAVSNEAVVTVFTGNLSPVAEDDSADTDEDTPVTIDVLDNDSDADGSIEPNTVLITSGPYNGSVDVNEVEGTVTYSPDTGFAGTDTFTYTVADDEGAVSNEATATINPENIPPMANDDSAYTKEPNEVTINILANDKDSDGSIDPGIILVTAGPNNGTLVVHDSWVWNFGDGQQSHEQNPRHTYSEVGNYTVSLTVTDADGQSASETKNNFVRVIVYEKSIDNVDYPKTHSGGKVWVYTKGLEVPKEDMKYTRMLYESCNSGNYFIEVYDRGIMFYTVTSSGGLGSVSYLRSYLEGKSDEEIWEIIQDVEPSYDYYNFNELPPASVPQAMTQSASMLAADRAIIAAEPVAEYVLSPDEEEKIRQLENLSLSEVFERLKDADFLVDEALLHNAISIAFKDTQTEAVAIALKYIKLPIVETVDGRVVNRVSDFYVAKKILHLFCDESIQQLLELYESGNAVTKSNVVRAIGRLADDQAVKNMLIKALDDKTSCKDKHPEISGEPLRICDLAYNQLVLHYKLKTLLRAIGTMHSIEVRDYHIDILKSRLM